MRVFYTNLVDASGTAISSSSAASGLPVSNVANELKAKVWRTGTASANENVTFDLGSAQAITSVIIFAHTLTSGDSTIQLRGSTDNFAASDVLISNLTWASSVISAAFSTVTYRYYRIVFTKASAGVSRDIGRIFLGAYHSTEIQPDFDGCQISPVDLSEKQMSAGGQTYSERRNQYRNLKLTFSAASQSQKESFRTICEAVGTHTSFFVQIDPTGSSEIAEVLYVKFAKALGRDVAGMDSDLTWNMTLELAEQL